MNPGFSYPDMKESLDSRLLNILYSLPLSKHNKCTYLNDPFRETRAYSGSVEIFSCLDFACLVYNTTIIHPTMITISSSTTATAIDRAICKFRPSYTKTRMIIITLFVHHGFNNYYSYSDMILLCW